jgi:hypothetical protein
MTWRDKLEIGLKENAAFRKDNLPAGEVSGPELPQGPGRSAEIPRSREPLRPAKATDTKPGGRPRSGENDSPPE